MHYFNLALAALGAIASAAPAPAAPAGDFEILTCTAGSIKVVVVTYSNTALIASSELFCRYIDDYWRAMCGRGCSSS